jgi:hypothetical protein
MSYSIVKHKNYQDDKALINKLNDVISESYAVAANGDHFFNVWLRKGSLTS